MNNRSSSAGLLIVLVIGIGLVAGILAMAGGDGWSPRNYVAHPGDCFVPPQGDPLYDAHYAQQVNTYNCEAFKTQAQAKFIDAQTEQTRVNTLQGIMGVYLIFGIAAATLILLLIARARGGG